MRKNSAETVQAPTLGGGNVISPYVVMPEDRVVEFITAGEVECRLENGTLTNTTVLGGARYAIGAGVTVITFAGVFNIDTDYNIVGVCHNGVPVKHNGRQVTYKRS